MASKKGKKKSPKKEKTKKTSRDRKGKKTSKPKPKPIAPKEITLPNEDTEILFSPHENVVDDEEHGTQTSKTDLVDPAEVPPKVVKKFGTGLQKASERLDNVAATAAATTKATIKKGSLKKRVSIEEVGLPYILLDKSHIKNLVEVKPEEKQIDAELSEAVDHYRGRFHKLDQEKIDRTTIIGFPFSEMVQTLKGQGIPLPSEGDELKIELSQGVRWDPSGAVIEYFSPVLRSFIPVNMRGGYRGCRSDEDCVKGLDLSKLRPKTGALEGFVDQNLNEKTKEQYQQYHDVATDEAHLDYLIELQKCQAETLPIPLVYDTLHFGFEVLTENLEVILASETIAPTNRIYESTEEQAMNVRRKIEAYANLGLEPLSSVSDFGKIDPLWEMTRDDLISFILERRHAPDEYEEMIAEVSRLHEELYAKGKMSRPPNMEKDSVKGQDSNVAGPSSGVPASTHLKKKKDKGKPQKSKSKNSQDKKPEELQKKKSEVLQKKEGEQK